MARITSGLWLAALPRHKTAQISSQNVGPSQITRGASGLWVAHAAHHLHDRDWRQGRPRRERVHGGGGARRARPVGHRRRRRRHSTGHSDAQEVRCTEPNTQHARCTHAARATRQSIRVSASALPAAHSCRVAFAGANPQGGGGGRRQPHGWPRSPTASTDSRTRRGQGPHARQSAQVCRRASGLPCSAGLLCPGWPPTLASRQPPALLAVEPHTPVHMREGGRFQ